jgi:hypothetical protein
MRAGNARTSVKPGRREETRSVGYAVRPRRLRPTLPPPDPRWRRWLGANSAISRRGASLRPPRAKRPRRRRGAARCGAATLGPPHYDQPQTCLRGRTRISPATSRILLGALVWKSASGEAHRRHRASRRTRSGEERRSGDGPAGPAWLIEQNQPTGVTTRCGLRCSDGLRQRLDAVACLCIKSNSSVRGSARIAPACHRNVVLQA